MHWLPAPASANVVDVVEGELRTVLVVVLGPVVVDEACALGADVELGVSEHPVSKTTKADVVKKATRSRFTSRNYPSAGDKSTSLSVPLPVRSGSPSSCPHRSRLTLTFGEGSCFIWWMISWQLVSSRAAPGSRRND